MSTDSTDNLFPLEYELNGVRYKTMQELLEHAPNGVNKKTFMSRIYLGWSVERAATEPVHTNYARRSAKKKKNRVYSYKGKSYTLSQLHRFANPGISKGTLCQRLSCGLKVEDALTLPMGYRINSETDMQKQPIVTEMEHGTELEMIAFRWLRQNVYATLAPGEEPKQVDPYTVEFVRMSYKWIFEFDRWDPDWFTVKPIFLRTGKISYPTHRIHVVRKPDLIRLVEKARYDESGTDVMSTMRIW